MSFASPVPTLDVERAPGKPPLLQVDLDDDGLTWVTDHRDSLRHTVAEHGSVHVRGLGLRDAAQVGAVFRALSVELMTEREAFASRPVYTEGVYGSSTWPANQPMCMHHELSYAVEFPQLMLFACLVAPTDGGASAVADSPAVLEALPADLVQRFEREGWLLCRTYGGEIGTSVADAFGTDNRDAVESYCRANAIAYQWRDDRLYTRQRRSAVVQHQVTGRRCWFNQIAFLNEHTLDPEVREFLLDVYGDDGLPFTTRYGNGEPIGADVVQLLNEVYDAHTVREPWRAGDLMLVDNVRTAHSREPYQGSREVLVGLADPMLRGDGASTDERTSR